MRALGDGGERQEAEIGPEAQHNGVTLAQFIYMMAKPLMGIGGMHQAEAIEYAIDLLKTQGEAFGDPDLDWTSAGAEEMVADDMQYWDEDGSLAN